MKRTVKEGKTEKRITSTLEKKTAKGRVSAVERKAEKGRTSVLEGKTVFEVFHSQGDFFWKALHYGHEVTSEELKNAFENGDYLAVGKIKLSNYDRDAQLETIFYLSQNLERVWNRRNPCRSTSVGDIVRVEGEYWVVAGQGFDLLQ